MKAAIIENHSFRFVSLPIPQPQPHETLIKVHAFGINRGDLLQAEGLYPSPDTNPIPGLEVSGIDTQTGQAVCALVSSGAYAEYVVVDKRQLVMKPHGYSIEEAAGLLESLATCYLNIFMQAKAHAGQTILIHGGPSAIGTMAIRMSKLRNLHVICTSSSPAKLAHCLELGADEGWNYNEDYTQALKGKVDIILDILGASALSKNISCLKWGGYLLLIALLGGNTAEIPLGSVLMKNLSIIGSTLRARSIEQKQAIIQAALQDFSSEFASGVLTPIIDSVFSFDQLEQALSRVFHRQNIGKVVVSLQNQDSSSQSLGNNWVNANKSLEYKNLKSKIFKIDEKVT